MLRTKLKLLELICYRSDESKEDEIFIKMEGVRVWPDEQKYISTQEGSVKLDVILDIDLGSKIVLELWDYDLLSPNDKLGEFCMIADQRGAEFITDLRINDNSMAKYSLKWELL